MKIKNHEPVIVIGALVLMVMIFQNCSGVDFASAPAQKVTTSSTPNPNPGPTPGPTPGPNPNPTPGPTPTPTPPTLDPNGCPTVLPVATVQCRMFLEGASSWKVPCDWNQASNKIEAIGNGYEGGGDVRAGGGGGAYAQSVNVPLVRGSTVGLHTDHIGMSWPGGDSLAGHPTGFNSGDTYLCNSTSGCTALHDAAVVVGAAGGKSSTNGPYLWLGGTDAIGGIGGQASDSVASGPGAVKYSGGNGGDCQGQACTPSNQPGSGGGAAGPHGNGSPGGAGAGTGGAGDAGYGGAGGGDAQPGANGTEWDASHGSGGGGGGASGYVVNGGAGGIYGGGGGGGGSQMTPWGQILGVNWGGAGGRGLVVVTYLGSSCN